MRGHPRHTRCGPSVCCHRKTWASSREDWNNVFGACVFAHAEQEGKTQAFERRYDVDLKRECIRITHEFALQATH